MARTNASEPLEALARGGASRASDRRPANGIADVTIETLARGFCREASGYGFGQIEFVKFVNAVLDQSTSNDDRRGPRPVCASDRLPLEKLPCAGEVSRLPLRGARVVLRSLEPGTDLGLLKRWLADPGNRDFLLSRVTAKAADIGELVGDSRNAFGIIALCDGTPIGAMAFLDHDPVQRKAEMRKLIGEPAHRGKGLGKEASALWIRYGLAQLRLRKIYVSTFQTSVRNVRLNEELGLRIEGILRNEVLVDGTYMDVLRMALCRDGDRGDREPSEELDPE